MSTRSRGRAGNPLWVAASPGMVVALLLAAMAFPLYWLLVSSITPEASLFEAPALLPRGVSFDHYSALFAEREFWLPIRNSLIVAGATTALCILIATPCAYAVARLRFRGKTPILAFVLAVSMFPQISIVSPLYIVLREVRLIDTYPGLVLPYLTFAMPLTIWLLVAFFRQLPMDLEEAAIVDGATQLRALRSIILPLAAPGLATTAILTFLYSWNEFLFALSFTLGPDRHTVPVAIALFRGQYQIPWGQILAAAVIATAPVAALVLFFQRHVIAGLTAGALKA